MITTRALHVRNNPENKSLVEMVWQKEVYIIAKRILVFSVTDKKYGLVRKAKTIIPGRANATIKVHKAIYIIIKVSV